MYHLADIVVFFIFVQIYVIFQFFFEISFLTWDYSCVCCLVFVCRDFPAMSP